jgi:hypothetical protein
MDGNRQAMRNASDDWIDTAQCDVVRHEVVAEMA